MVGQPESEGDHEAEGDVDEGQNQEGGRNYGRGVTEIDEMLEARLCVLGTLLLAQA
ncbi:hypothetical protein QMK17_11285 [Rhodococcus sp. G-MC3]|uniref:hypothetical protein n=1 Tax=Rhodococcus sp. G-MC3 TaxID=3046209 RepID=UPI0024BB96D5|nr:hypothetical protein [Rhodococcus sp. G-MC3]MDJ0393913.1 hypothetical protein [Rhodococcus sp. G-MC3]